MEEGLGSLAATDVGAAGVWVDRDQGCHRQLSTMMLLDSMGNGFVGNSILFQLSPFLHKVTHCDFVKKG